MKILVVDDDPTILELLTLFLETIGYEETVAMQGAAAAIGAMDSATVPFDCLIVDIQMPEMSGIELVAHVRSDPRYRDTPILMLTAMGDKQHVQMSFSAGATDYVQKPFDLADLEARLYSAALYAGQRAHLRHRKRRQEQRGEAPGGQLTRDLEADIGLSGRDGFVSSVIFDNCLIQLQNSSPRDLRVIGVHWLNFEELEAAVGQDVLGILTGVMETALAEVMSAGTFICAYKGDGRFAVADLAEDRPSVGALFAELSARISQASQRLTDRGLPMPETAFGLALPDASRASVSALEVLEDALAQTGRTLH